MKDCYKSYTRLAYQADEQTSKPQTSESNRGPASGSMGSGWKQIGITELK